MTEVRDRVTNRVSRARLALEARRSAGPMAVILLAALASLLGGGWVLSHVASTLVSSSQTVSFAVENADGVKPNLDEVRFRGIPAGRIVGIDLKNNVPIVKVKIESKYGHIYQDAHAVLRPNSALEDMYLDIVDRGTKAAGNVRSGQILPATQTDTPVNINDALAVFNADTRTRLRYLLSDLGKGLDNRGMQLKTAFVQTTSLLQAAGRLTHQAARRKALVAGLVTDAADLTGELAARERQLRTLLRTGSAVVTAVKERQPAFDATLVELPRVLQSMHTSFSATRGVLGDVDAAVVDLRPVADRLDRALGAVRRLTALAAPAVRDLQGPVRRLNPLARAVSPLSASLSRTVQQLRPQTDTLAKVTTGLVRCKTGIQNFFQWDASMTKFGDARGWVPRGNLAFGVQSSGLSNADEFAPTACDGRTAIGGRPPTATDGR